MKTIEFQTQIDSHGNIEIPIQYRHQFIANQKVRVIVLLEDVAIDESWKKHITNHFFSGYSDEDSIYDVLQ